jgi:hypothetical protein
MSKLFPAVVETAVSKVSINLSWYNLSPELVQPFSGAGTTFLLRWYNLSPLVQPFSFVGTTFLRSYFSYP